MININEIIDKNDELDTFEIGIKQVVKKIAFNFDDLAHPFDHEAKNMNEFQQKRNDYFHSVQRRCQDALQTTRHFNFKSIFCKIMHQLESALVYKLSPWTKDEEPSKQSWSDAKMFWKSIINELKDYDPITDRQTETVDQIVSNFLSSMRATIEK